MTYSIRFTEQYLELAGVPLSTPAWELLNIEALLSGPATRGSNVILPGASGVRPRRRRATARTVTLELSVTGSFGPDGVKYDDPVLGLLTNLELLRAITDPSADNNSVITATLHWKGASRTGGVQVENFEVGKHDGPTDVPATIDLTILSGALA